ncbi:MAG: beta-lactamase family protein [Lachnospiraceae bacterium]|nr:beta-lactamase family protein [Lachnospiraceae bacterium]
MMEFRKSMDRLLGAEVESGNLAGVSALALHHGKEIYESYFGDADREAHVPMARDTIIRLYSMTKPVTAAAVMILAERGLIDLLDPVSRYLPEFGDMTVLPEPGREEKCQREITLTDLLNMTSGILYPEYWEGCNPAGRKVDEVLRPVIRRIAEGEVVSTREFVRKIAECPLGFQPGERWGYGYGADVLGAVVEVAAGMSFEEFLKKEIFDPLQMADTGFFVPKEKLPRFAMSYDGAGEGVLIPATASNLGEYYTDDGKTGRFASGGAGLVSTLDDYARFAQMMVSGGSFKGQRILGEHTVRFMTRNRLRPDQMGPLDWCGNRGYGYGNLMRVLVDQKAAGSNAALGEFGWDGWTGNYVSMDPENDLVFLLFTQKRGVVLETLIRRLKFILYGAI